MSPQPPVMPGPAWWNSPTSALMQTLQTSARGLAPAQVRERLRRQGPNMIRRQREWPWVLRLLARFGNPLVLVLLVASLTAALTGDRTSFAFVSAIVVLSVVLDFVQ